MAYDTGKYTKWNAVEQGTAFFARIVFILHTDKPIFNQVEVKMIFAVI